MAAAALILTGCQQAQKLQNDTTNAINAASQQIETTKTQVVETKNKIDEKVTQAQQAADAIKKLGQ